MYVKTPHYEGCSIPWSWHGLWIVCYLPSGKISNLKIAFLNLEILLVATRLCWTYWRLLLEMKIAFGDDVQSWRWPRLNLCFQDSLAIVKIQLVCVFVNLVTRWLVQIHEFRHTVTWHNFKISSHGDLSKFMNSVTRWLGIILKSRHTATCPNLWIPSHGDLA
jgi:hypothetical protein